MNSLGPEPIGQIKATIALGSIFFLRMFGLFLLIPVLSLYAVDLNGATPLLVGTALGIYGLTQGMMQIPLGMLSDQIGRKPVIAIGLCLFIIGSITAGLADHIGYVILGRSLQGAGAIAAATMALLADITSERYRTRAMAGIGINIGMAFILAMVLGPIFGARIGLNGLFYLGAGLAFLALGVLRFIPSTYNPRFHPGVQASRLRLWQVCRNTALLRFNLGIFFLHAVLMATFVALPLILQTHTTLSNSQHWYLYLPVLTTSIIVVLPYIMRADRKQTGTVLYPAMVTLLLLSQMGFVFWYQNIASIAAALLLFFVAFNYLEASLPAMVSKEAPTDIKGTALGLYATGQFFGAFIGGVGGGLSLEFAGYAGVFIFNTVVVGLWLVSLAGFEYLCSRE